MKEQLITCPHCKQQFPLSQAMQHEIEEKVKLSHLQEIEAIKKEYQTQIEAATKDSAYKAAEKARQDAQKELQDLQNQVTELETKSSEFNEKELAYLKREREIAAKEKQMQLERERFINTKTEELQSSIREEVEAELSTKLSEKDLKIARLEKLADELKKKAQQGSGEVQGEAFELELENLLRQIFAVDEFEPVPRGKRGADIIQKVRTDNLRQCGTIIWEAKNAENWSDNWVVKLKADMRQTAGDVVGIIVTKALPKTIKTFGFVDGVWVTDFYSAVGLATAIRMKFMELHQTKAAIAGRSSIRDLIYVYVTGTEFRNRIEATGEALRDMKNDIDKERAAMEKNWAKREKQLFRVVQNMAGVYGDLSGLGAQLQQVKTLELEAGDVGE